MNCDTNQFPALTFCGSNPKPHGERGLSKHYYLRFYTKLGHRICAIRCIPCACVVYGIPEIQGLSSIDIHPTQAHGMQRIAHIL